MLLSSDEVEVLKSSQSNQERNNIFNLIFFFFTLELKKFEKQWAIYVKLQDEYIELHVYFMAQNYSLLGLSENFSALFVTICSNDFVLIFIIQWINFFLIISASRRWGWSLCLVQIVGVAVWSGSRCCWRCSMMWMHWLQRLDNQCLSLCSTLVNQVYVNVALKCWC